MSGLNPVKKTKSAFIKRCVLFVFVMVLASELVLRIFPSLYIPALSKNIYFCDSDSQMLRTSDNSELVYVLNPSAHLTDSNVHPLETKYSERRVSINSSGFRGKDFAREKPEGVFRIIVLGGANTYGVMVSDEDTYPAVMERMLNEKFPSGHFEVINAGICGYALSQQSESGLFAVEDFNPDLVIMQVSNTGRRAFLREQNIYDYISVNPRLMLENIPCALSPDWSLSGWHEKLLWHSALYRSINVWLNCLILDEDGSPETNSRQKPFSSVRADFLEKVTALGARNGWAMFEQFSSICCAVPIVFFDPAGVLPDTHYAGIDTIRLDPKDKAKEYTDILPSSHVYEWYAGELIRELEKRGLIKS